MSEPTKDAVEAARTISTSSIEYPFPSAAFMLRIARALDRFASTRDARIAELEGLIREARDWIARFPQIGHRFNLDRLDRALSPVAPRVCKTCGSDAPGDDRVDDGDGTFTIYSRKSLKSGGDCELCPDPFHAPRPTPEGKW